MPDSTGEINYRKRFFEILKTGQRKKTLKNAQKTKKMILRIINLNSIILIQNLKKYHKHQIKH